ncbi:hypothetical protein C8J57DRAFT_1481715 [Mycena rebaudengoi]|nr:hypothetical protein C8J57DRAFT_1481715 [Mycena rebaudengoi]
MEGGSNKQNKRQNHSPPVPISSFRIPYCAFGVERAALVFKRVARAVPQFSKEFTHAIHSPPPPDPLPPFPSPCRPLFATIANVHWGLAVHLCARGGRRLAREERGFERSELGARDSTFDTLLLGPLCTSCLPCAGGGEEISDGCGWWMGEGEEEEEEKAGTKYYKDNGTGKGARY